MSTALGSFAVLVAAVATSFPLLTGRLAPDETTIREAIGGLRKLPDSERAVVTKDLAMQIRALPAGKTKMSLASGLCNLSTEGDFGRDTLQTVTDTLAAALKETPAEGKDGQVAWPYMQLAQLSKYEGMSVDLQAPEYAAARKRLDEIDDKRKAIDFALQDLSGKTWKLSELKGKVVMVNFWATWCPPCRKEMPDMERLYNRFKEQGLVILAISDEEREKVDPFIAEHKYTFPVLLDPGRKVGESYVVEGIPKTFIYDREGKLAAQSIDMRTERQFLDLLSKAGLK